MQKFNQDSIFRQFITNQAGETPTRLALMFAAATVFGTLLFMPLVNDVTQKIVHNGLGIDNMTTASTRQSSKKYIIRKSVLNQEGSVICLKGKHEMCKAPKN